MCEPDLFLCDMKLVSVLSAVSALATTTLAAKFSRHHELTESYTFRDYLQESGKSYSNPEEMKMRQSIFEHNLQKIRTHNADKTQTWKMGVNKFTDMTEAELKYWKGGNKHSLRNNKKLTTKHSSAIDLKSLPTSIDWRDSDVVTAVKDQVISLLLPLISSLSPGSLWQLLGSSCG
jgi:C1A family cysteine protease